MADYDGKSGRKDSPPRSRPTTALTDMAPHRSLEKGKSEWALVALAYNCKRMATLSRA
jgi:hypothetical protein